VETQRVERNYPLLPALLQPPPKSQLQKPFTGGRFFMGYPPICFVRITSAREDINLNGNGYQRINHFGWNSMAA
jgi:hypothetical protein